MWVMSSLRLPQFLGHADVSHDPLVAITFLLGRSLAASIIYHMSCCGGDFLVTALSASQSTWGCDISWSDSILCHKNRKILKVVLYFESMILVEPFSPNGLFLFSNKWCGDVSKESPVFILDVLVHFGYESCLLI